MFSVFPSSYRNNSESLGELEKAEPHSVSHSSNLPLMFLLNNWIMSSRFLPRDS